MDTEITSALIILAVAIIGSLGTLIKAMVDHLAKELAENTSITKQARDSSNGQLTSVIAQLAAERNTVQGLRGVVRERDDRIAYLVARLPEAQELMRNYSERRTARASEADVLAAEKHLLGSGK